MAKKDNQFIKATVSISGPGYAFQKGSIASVSKPFADRLKKSKAAVDASDAEVELAAKVLTVVETATKKSKKKK